MPRGQTRKARGEHSEDVEDKREEHQAEVQENKGVRQAKRYTQCEKDMLMDTRTLTDLDNFVVLTGRRATM